MHISLHIANLVIYIRSTPQHWGGPKGEEMLDAILELAVVPINLALGLATIVIGVIPAAIIGIIGS